jgi:hypothetical protein
MTQGKPYTCPRCDYRTMQRGDMHRHLYVKKKPCPAQEADVELTSDVKQFILKNRVYHIRVTNNIHQTINQNNTIIHYIAGLDAIEKMQRYLDYNKIELNSLEQTIEDKYSTKARRLENDGYKYGFELKTENLFEVIDEVSNASKCKTLEDLNIYYDSSVDKMHVYDGEWDEMLLSSGAKRLIETIQTYYWDAYECFLIRKASKGPPGLSAQHCRELLDEYFKFIGCFDVNPFCKDKSDDAILARCDSQSETEVAPSPNSFSLSDEYGARYVRIRDNTTKSDINFVKKRVMDIIKKNSQRNITELNKRIFGLFKMDEGFKQNILNM